MGVKSLANDHVTEAMCEVQTAMLAGAEEVEQCEGYKGMAVECKSSASRPTKIQIDNVTFREKRLKVRASGERYQKDERVRPCFYHTVVGLQAGERPYPECLTSSTL